jgi:hypothetical protein
MSPCSSMAAALVYLPELLEACFTEKDLAGLDIEEYVKVTHSANAYPHCSHLSLPTRSGLHFYPALCCSL